MSNNPLRALPFYQVNAFTSEPFSGNPAGVCPLTLWPEDALLQAIATENNLSETAFFVPTDEGFQLRWFTPAVEVDLCGHATLAAAWVLFNRLGHGEDPIRFTTRSGILTVSRAGDEYCMDFPAKPVQPIEAPEGLLAALGIQGEVEGIWQSDDILVLVKEQEVIAQLAPDFNKLAEFKTRGVIVTAAAAAAAAAAEGVDFVSRWFGPQVGVNEDPVTGSAHTFLAPFWAGRLGKSELSAQQGGRRKGMLRCLVKEDDRVVLYGSARLMIEGTFRL